MPENCLASVFIHGHHQTILLIHFGILRFNATAFFFITLCTGKEMSSIFMCIIKVKAYSWVPLFFGVFFSAILSISDPWFSFWLSDIFL